jgi:DNA invertase Pin-like site-specific DNA recombinase
LRRALDHLDKGDVLMVTRLDRLARSIQLQRPERDSAR